MTQNEFEKQIKRLLDKALKEGWSRSQIQEFAETMILEWEENMRESV
jgi:phage baseplate assembly protein W